MASFAQQTRPEFSQYVPQYNVGLYSQVGMQRQAQYEAGYQAIQSAFDRIGGLELSRDIDKQYLQEKLDRSLTEANKMVGADYSKQSVVSGLSSQAMSIARDTNVQRAVLATANVKKAMTEADEARKKGEGWSPENQAWLDNQVQNWYGNAEVGAGFNGGFVRYTDNNKALTDFLKDKHPNSTLTQQPNGEYTLIEVDGKAISAEDIRRETREFLQSDGRYMQQSQINGWYANRGANPQSLIDSRLSSRISTLDKLEREALQLKDSADPKVVKAAEDQLEQIRIGRENIGRDRQSLTSMAFDNPMGFYTDMYIDRTANMMADRYSYSEISQKTVKNPEFEAMQQQLANKIAYDKYLDDMAFNRDSHNLAREKFEYEKTKDQWEQLNGKKTPGSGSGVPGANGAIIPTPAQIAGGPSATQLFNDDLISRHNDLDQGMMDVMSDYSATRGLFRSFNNGAGIQKVYAGQTPQQQEANRQAVQKEFAQLLQRYNSGEKLPAELSDKLATYSDNYDMYNRMVTIKRETDREYATQYSRNPQTAAKTPEAAIVRSYESIPLSDQSVQVGGRTATAAKGDIYKAMLNLRQGQFQMGVRGYTPDQQIDRLLSTTKDPSMQAAYEYLRGQVRNWRQAPKALTDLYALTNSQSNGDTPTTLKGWIDGDRKVVDHPGIREDVDARNRFYDQKYLAYAQQSGNDGQLIPHTGETGQVLLQQLLAMATANQNIQVIDGKGSHTSTPEEANNLAAILQAKFDKTAVTYYQPRGRDPYYVVSNAGDDDSKFQAVKFTIPKSNAELMGIYKNDPVGGIRDRLNLDRNKTTQGGTLLTASTDMGNGFYSAMPAGEVRDNDGSFLLKYHVKQGGPNQYYATLYAKDMEASRQQGRPVVYPIPYQSTADNNLNTLKDKIESLRGNPQAATLIRAAINGGAPVSSASKSAGGVGTQVAESLGRSNPYLDVNNRYMNP